MYSVSRCHCAREPITNTSSRSPGRGRGVMRLVYAANEASMNPGSRSVINGSFSVV